MNNGIERKRVAWVISHPIQYHVPVFRELESRPEIDFTVLYLTHHGVEPSYDPGFGRTLKWDVPLLDGYKYEFVPKAPSALRGGLLDSLSMGIDGALTRGKYHAVVVCGWTRLGYVQATLTARRLGARIIHLSDSTLVDRKRSLPKRLIRKLVFGLYFSKDDHALATGIASRRYLVSLGISPEKVHAYPHNTDPLVSSSQFINREDMRKQFRERLHILPNSIVFLFCGKLVSKKNPVSVVEAYRRIVAKRNALGAIRDVELLIVGSGELEEKIRYMAKHVEGVHLLGFRNQTELAEVYSAADVIVLPSTKEETWGLVVNEAMALGNAVIVSDRVGCQEDLVAGWDTGIVVPADDDNALEQAMDDISSDTARLTLWQANARRRIACFTPTRAADGVVEAALAR